MPRLAANLGYLFKERDMFDRVAAAAAAGFAGIELQFPYEIPASKMKAEIERNKLTILGVNSLPGEPEFGLAAIAGREKECEEFFIRARDYAAEIGARTVHVLSGKVPVDQRPAAERVYISNLSRLADLAAEKNLGVLIEPINPHDRPNYFMNRPEHAADVIAKVGKANVKIQFDFYHVQIMGGDLLRRFERFLPVIGHVQIGAVPSRHEPDEGEVNYAEVLKELDRLGYQGWIGCEYRPRGRTEDGLGWARPYGVIPR